MSSADHATRARSFGQVAAEYDRWRPGYPDALIADVLALGPDAPRVVEAGAGTGRATVALAQRGARITAVEPDAEMAAVARERTREHDVTFQIAAFEDADLPAGAFDLVVSAQAWHWVDYDRAAAVAARALAPGGSLCLWWNRPGALAGPGWEAVHAAYARIAPELDRRGRPQEAEPRAITLDPAPGFGAWSQRTYDWEVAYDADAYCGLVQTHSDHVTLPAAERERIVAAVHAAITGAPGGQVVYDYRTLLLTASPSG